MNEQPKPLIPTAIERIKDLNEEERKQMTIIGYLIVNLINTVVEETKKDK